MAQTNTTQENTWTRSEKVKGKQREEKRGRRKRTPRIARKYLGSVKMNQQEAREAVGIKRKTNQENGYQVGKERGRVEGRDTRKHQ